MKWMKEENHVEIKNYCCKVPSYIVFLPNKFAARYVIDVLKGAKEKKQMLVPLCYQLITSEYYKYIIFTRMLSFYINSSQNRSSSRSVWFFWLNRKSSDGQNLFVCQIQRIEKIQFYPGWYTPTLILWVPWDDGPLWRNLTRPSHVIGC